MSEKPEELAKQSTKEAEREREIERLEHELRAAKERELQLRRRALDAEQIRESVYNLASGPVDAPDWTLEQSRASDVPHIPVLVTSDFQWGEVIDHDNMDGINRFDVEIARERYRLLIDRTVDLAFEHLPKNRYEGIVVLRLGDTVSGDIHEDLRVSNELAAIPAVRSVVESETWGLRQLADAFGKVHVVSTPGNHGRYQMKPPSKHIPDNYDSMASWWLESLLQKDSRLSWQTSKSTDCVFTMHGRQYLATHGDNIGSKGGQGFIGPAATIMRGMKKTMDEYARRGIPLSKMFVGHFHTAYDLGYGWSNGSLPGYSEYARSFRMTPEAPVQWLIFFHPKYGSTSQWKIQLAPEPAGTTVVAPFVGGAE